MQCQYTTPSSSFSVQLWPDFVHRFALFQTSPSSIDGVQKVLKEIPTVENSDNVIPAIKLKFTATTIRQGCDLATLVVCVTF